jgi:hypothetical protein
MTSVAAPVEDVLEEKSSDSTTTLPKEEKGLPRGDAEANVVDVGPGKDEPSSFSSFNRSSGLLRRLSLVALAALIFGWWVSATTLHATRHRWIVQTFFAWSFIAIIAFRFIPNSVVTRPVEAVWVPLVQNPFFNLPRYARYGLGWLALLAIVLGSAFGFKLENVSVSYIYMYILGLRCGMPVRQGFTVRSSFIYSLIRVLETKYNKTGHDLWRPRDLRAGSVGFPIRLLGDVATSIAHPMADCHSWPVHAAGHSPFRAQVRRRLPPLQVACSSRIRLPRSGSRRRCFFLRSGYC